MHMIPLIYLTNKKMFRGNYYSVREYNNFIRTKSPMLQKHKRLPLDVYLSSIPLMMTFSACSSVLYVCTTANPKLIFFGSPFYDKQEGVPTPFPAVLFQFIGMLCYIFSPNVYFGICSS